MTCSSTPGTGVRPAAQAQGPGPGRAARMLIDSYESPAAQSLLRLGRERHAEPRRVPHRLLVTETAGAAVFIVAAGILAALGSSARHFSLVACAVMVGMYVAARSVQFPVGS